MVGAHAIALLLVFPVVVGGAYAFRRRAKTEPFSAWAVVAGVVAAFACLVVAMLNVHACGRGQPVREGVVVALAALVAVPLVGTRRARWRTGSVLVVVAFVLSFHYTALVHGAYVGSADGLTPEEGATRPTWHTVWTGLHVVVRPT